MKTPLQITFRGMEKSDFLEKDIREKAKKLEEFFNNITGCHVIVEMHHKHHHQGNLFHVRIDVVLPGKEIVVNRAPTLHHAHEDAYVAVRDAFDAARRQLQEYHEKLKHHVKSHNISPHGNIVRIYPSMDYGILESSDGREIYFHRNSIINADFDDLEVGNMVRFTETAGDEGPQASTVFLERKHHVAG